MLTTQKVTQEQINSWIQNNETRVLSGKRPESLERFIEQRKSMWPSVKRMPLNTKATPPGF
tara:strand:- start:479 stop:661 length:183 start_codon:yes stop_codon:yes gene_type:complete